MREDAVDRYQKDAINGHRPTWKMGMAGGPRLRRLYNRFFPGREDADDPLDVLREFGAYRRSKPLGAEPERRALRNAERKALHSLGLEDGAGRAEIKGRFKDLVKRHHPDVNGGDRGSEDKLREIIEAYRYLKSAGLC
jgi:hypothetical protein